MLDLISTATRAVAIAMATAGNAKQTATLHIGQSRAYDYATDQSTGTGGTNPTVEGVFYRAQNRQREEITGNEAMFLIAATDAPAGITEADTIAIAGNGSWEIFDVERVPTGAIFILHIRKAGN